MVEKLYALKDEVSITDSFELTTYEGIMDCLCGSEPDHDRLFESNAVVFESVDPGFYYYAGYDRKLNKLIGDVIFIAYFDKHNRALLRYFCTEAEFQAEASLRVLHDFQYPLVSTAAFEKRDAEISERYKKSTARIELDDPFEDVSPVFALAA